MVSTSPNTTKILTTRQKTNITSAREQKQGEYNDIFFDRKVENVTEGLKSDNFTKYCRIML